MASREKPTAQERKRAWERAILGMVYDVPELDHWEHRDRPDFAIWTPSSDRAVGVEVTQIFPSESHARLQFIDGYLESLWQGGPHRHRDDVTTLHSARVSIHSQDGVLKNEDVPVVLTASPTEEDRRRALYEALKAKTWREYPTQIFRHINLIVLDWFGLKFDASEYSTDQLFDTDLKDLLRRCAFHEVFFLLESTKSQESGSRRDEVRYVYLRLVELFLTSEYFLTGSAIAQSGIASQVEGPSTSPG